MAQLVKNPLAMQETWVQSLGGKIPWRSSSIYSLQYSGLENSMDCIVYGVAKSQTQLSNFYLVQRRFSLSVENFQHCLSCCVKRLYTTWKGSCFNWLFVNVIPQSLFLLSLSQTFLNEFFFFIDWLFWKGSLSLFNVLFTYFFFLLYFSLYAFPQLIIKFPFLLLALCLFWKHLGSFWNKLEHHIECGF